MREVREFKSRHPDHSCSAAHQGNVLSAWFSIPYSRPTPDCKAFRILTFNCLLLIALPAALTWQAASAEELPGPRPIRVGLSHGIGKPHTLTITCDVPFVITDVESKATVAEVGSGDRASLTTAQGTVEISIEGAPARGFKGPMRVEAACGEGIIEVVSPKVRHKRYRGALEIRAGSGLMVVNELDVEQYLYGVVPVEVPAGFHREAQKALAVAARTYAVRSLGRHKSAGYDLCDGIHCQGYVGADRESDWSRKIVDDTRGQIVVYDGEPIYALYSSDCGGMTQNNEDAGMGKKAWPYLRSIVDNPGGRRSAVSGQQSAVSGEPPGLKADQDPQYQDYCAGNRYHTWRKTYTPEELERVFSRFGSTRLEKFVSMEFAEYDSSGRVKTVVIKGEKGERRISGSRLRGILGLNVLRSTRIILTVSEDGNYVIDGKGHGHGIGLCMHGANGLAKSREGITYVDILKHYYTGTEVRDTAD